MSFAQLTVQVTSRPKTKTISQIFKFKKAPKKERQKNLFATNNNDIKQEKQRNNTEVSS